MILVSSKKGTLVKRFSELEPGNQKESLKAWIIEQTMDEINELDINSIKLIKNNLNKNMVVLFFDSKI